MKRPAVWAVLLAFVYSLAGEGGLYLLTHQTRVPDYMSGVVVAVIVAYAIPIFAVYRGKSRWWSLLIVPLYPVFAIVLAVLFGQALSDGRIDPGFGLLGIAVWVINGFCIGAALITGLVARWVYEENRTAPGTD